MKTDNGNRRYAGTEYGGTPVYCQSCEDVNFVVSSDLLVVRAKHHGEWHVSNYPLRQVTSGAELILPDGRTIMISAR